MGNFRLQSLLIVVFSLLSLFSQSQCTPKIICLEGNAGAGKSTLAKKLKEYFESDKCIELDGAKPNVEIVMEPFDYWNNFGSGKWNLFDLFLKDSKNWNLLFNIFTFFTRLEGLKKAATPGEDKTIILDRSPWSSNPYNMVGMQYKTLNDYDIQVFNYITSNGALRIKNKNGVLTSSKDHHATSVVRLLLQYVQRRKCRAKVVSSLPDKYKELAQYLCSQINTFQKFEPGMFVFLNTPWKEAFDRAENRDREYKDPNSQLGQFYHDLHCAHEKWLKKDEWLTEKIEDIPVCIVDGMSNFDTDEAVALQICSEIHEIILQESEGCESGLFESENLVTQI